MSNASTLTIQGSELAQMLTHGAHIVAINKACEANRAYSDRSDRITYGDDIHRDCQDETCAICASINAPYVRGLQAAAERMQALADMHTVAADIAASKRAYTVCEPFTFQPIVTMNYRKVPKAVRQAMAWEAELAAHFTPGNIILSDYWKTYDLVVAFHPATSDHGWYVEVVHCTADGVRVAGERVRIHYTAPSLKDKVCGNVNKLLQVA